MKIGVLWEAKIYLNSAATLLTYLKSNIDEDFQM